MPRSLEVVLKPNVKPEALPASIRYQPLTRTPHKIVSSCVSGGIRQGKLAAKHDVQLISDVVFHLRPSTCCLASAHISSIYGYAPASEPLAKFSLLGPDDASLCSP